MTFSIDFDSNWNFMWFKEVHMRKNHHTHRAWIARKNAIKKWINGLIKQGLPEPTNEQYKVSI